MRGRDTEGDGESLEACCVLLCAENMNFRTRIGDGENRLMYICQEVDRSLRLYGSSHTMTIRRDRLTPYNY